MHRTARSLLLAVVGLGIGLSVGCSREEGLKCESTERYGSAGSVPPLRVPDDLSVPDETEVLRIPDPVAGGEPGSTEGLPCIESPPDFFSGAPQNG